MRLIHIVPSVSEEASGATYAVLRLCESLQCVGNELTLAALDWAPLSTTPSFLHVFPVGTGPRRLGRSPLMYKWLSDRVATGGVDILHNHGMWQMNSIYPAWAARHGNVKLVCSTHGALSDWAMRHGSKAKRIFWPLLQQSALRQVACFHATAESEYEQIRRLGFKQPIATIPNGIDIPMLSPKCHNEYRTLLFLGRIHKVKGLDILLPAWREVQDLFPHWRLVIAGSDVGYNGSSGYLGELQRLAKELGIERLEFVGNLFGAGKIQAYRDAELFVLPSYSENFGITVAESLASSTPVIVSKGAPWAGLAQSDSGWWVDIGVASLVACLKQTMSLSSNELASRGENGRLWMQKEFSWNRIAERMSETYRWLSDRSLPKPACVRLD